MVNKLVEKAVKIFKKTLSRDILFSDECIFYEIDAHLRGYWWSLGMEAELPIVFQLYLGFSSAQAIRNSCEKINIAEWDVYDPKQSVAFLYAIGIRPKYTDTSSDPYYWKGKRYPYPIISLKKWLI